MLLITLTITVITFVGAMIIIARHLAAAREVREVRREAGDTNYHLQVEAHRLDLIQSERAIFLRNVCREDCCRSSYDIPPTLDRATVELWLESA